MKFNRRSTAYYVHCWFSAYGINLPKLWCALCSTPTYVSSYIRYKRLAGSASRSWPIALNYPQLADRYESGGSPRGHYFHQDLHVAQRIHANNPKRHIDVGSRVDGFVAHVACFREIEVFDIRPTQASVHRIRFSQCDLMNPRPEMTGMCDSLSCLHTLEHFGLGRYGDQLDPDGYRRGFAGLLRLLLPGGVFYFSVPIGQQRIEFNAHRVFSVAHILELANGALTLQGFSFVDDDGRFHAVTPAEAVAATAGLQYGCGIFEFRKPLG